MSPSALRASSSASTSTESTLLPMGLIGVQPIDAAISRNQSARGRFDGRPCGVLPDGMSELCSSPVGARQVRTAPGSLPPAVTFGVTVLSVSTEQVCFIPSAPELLEDYTLGSWETLFGQAANTNCKQKQVSASSYYP